MRKENNAEEQADPDTYVFTIEKPTLSNVYLRSRAKEEIKPRGTLEKRKIHIQVIVQLCQRVKRCNSSREHT